MKERVKLNLGCGYKKIKGFVNIDIRPEVNPDMLCDLSEGIPFESDSVETVVAFDFLEHIEMGKTVEMMTEIWRVLRDKGVFELFVPSTDGRGSFQDPSHRSFWNINSFKYYMEDDPHRILNGIKAKFGILSLKDSWTSVDDKIIHTRGRLYAIKS